MGNEVSDTPLAVAPSLQAQPAEQESVLAPAGSVCRTCLHGLRGLNERANCSECNAPVSDGLDVSWWGNTPIGYLQDLARHTRRAGIAATVIPVIYLASLLAVPSSATMAQRSVVTTAFTVVSIIAGVAATWLVARFYWVAGSLKPGRERTLTLACWGVVATQAITVWAILLPFLRPRGLTSLMMWSSIAYLIAGPLSILLAARAFVVLSKHIGGKPLKRLGVAHGVVGVAMLLLTLPLIGVYASFLSGAFNPSAWWLGVLSWLPSLLTWLTMAPVLTLPALMWVFSAALVRLIEARRAGS